MAFGGLRLFWKTWEQTILTFIAICIVGVSSYLFGLSHRSGSVDSLEITTTTGSNTVLCSAQCDTLGINPAVSEETPTSESVSAVEGLAQSDITGQVVSKCLFVGSINGSKYYPPDCKAVNRINKENLTCFSSVQDAQEKGYARTKAC